MLRVLQTKSEITRARKILTSRGLSRIDSVPAAVARRIGLLRGIAIGDVRKSWDLLLTVNFIGWHLTKSEPTLDLGCYASELLLVLHKLGHSNLSGIDLNPATVMMPHSKEILFKVGDFTRTQFSDASFRAVTSISTIEHGFCPTSLLREISRILKPGGFFTASFDYWVQKIDTTGVRIFDLDWMIFSAEEVQAFVAEAARFELLPVGDLHFDCTERPIHFGERHYTFAWLALQKVA